MARIHKTRLLVSVALALLPLACRSFGLVGEASSGTDSGPLVDTDAGVDAGTDAGPDTAPDAGEDKGPTCWADAGFGRPVRIPLVGPVPYLGWEQWGFVSADFNQDGIQDFAVATAYSQETQIFYGLADGGFVFGQYISSVEFRLVAADLNGDGWPDLVGAGLSGVDVMMNHRDGGFTLQSVGGNSPTYDIAVADFDGDGRLDIASGAYIGTEILFNDGTMRADGTPGFKTRAIETGPSYDVHALRLVPGQPPSLIWVDDQALTLGLLTGFGDGGFAASVLLQDAGVAIGRGTTADFNGDGLADFAVLTSKGLLTYLNIDGGFGPPAVTVPELGNVGWSLVASDLNGDGHADLVATRSSDCGTEGADGAASMPAILLNDGKGGFPNYAFLCAGSLNPTAVATVAAPGGGLPSIVIGSLCGSAFEVIPHQAL